MSTSALVRGATPASAAALTPARAKAVYRAAIDASALDREGAAWWDEVVTEVQAVVAAPDTRGAAALIAWWHADWQAIGDTPVSAAGRLRLAARAQRAVDGARREASPEASG